MTPIPEHVVLGNAEAIDIVMKPAWLTLNTCGEGLNGRALVSFLYSAKEGRKTPLKIKSITVSTVRAASDVPPCLLEAKADDDGHLQWRA